MAVHRHVIRAVFRRDFQAYFASPTGYVFITIFVFLAAVAAFWQDRFFAANLANLDTLNGVFPYLLLFFIPAVTMSTWAEERKQGTDELLLTLPTRDHEVVIGKYLAALGIYTVALAFSVLNVLALELLGDPDWGVMFGTYFAYWLLGGALIGVGMIGSLLAGNVTVGFILGSMLCALVVFLDRAAPTLPGALGEVVERYSAVPLFDQFAGGVVSFGGVVFFFGLAFLALFVNVALLHIRRVGRLGEGRSLGTHAGLRIASVAVAALAVTVLTEGSGVRADVTAERLHSLSPETRALIGSLPEDRPVFVQAFVSPEVPREYVATRTDLLNLLREYDSMGGGRVLVKVHETERHSDSAREAQEKFGIRAQTVLAMKDGRGATQDIYLGVAVTSGAQEVVVPFMHRGLPVEYELTRSIRVAAMAERLKVGVLTTDAKLSGGFDFQSMRSEPEWPIVSELKKQYDVVQVDPEAEYPAGLNVLLVAMPSSLTQPQMDRLGGWIRAGGPALLFDDPLPIENPGLAPKEQKPKPGGGGMFGGGPPPETKGDCRGFYESIGIDWPDSLVVWDAYNPHPQLQHLPPEVVFVGATSHENEPFSSKDPTTSGLQELVAMFPGFVRASPTSQLAFTPLIRSTTASGTLRKDEIYTRSFFGMGGFNERRAHIPTTEDYVLAAHVSGKTGGGAEGSEGGDRVNVIFVADLDVISSQFWAIRAQGAEDLSFDNVPFVLNAVDVLAGDESFVALRKERDKHRTLTAVESLTHGHNEKRLEQVAVAENEAKLRLEQAQEALDRRVEEVRSRTDLDERTKQIMVRTVQEAEQRKLDQAKAGIEDQKDREIEISEAEMDRAVRSIQGRIRILAVALPPIPALLLGIWVFLSRMKREKQGVSASRRAEGQS